MWRSCKSFSPAGKKEGVRDKLFLERSSESYTQKDHAFFVCVSNKRPTAHDTHAGSRYLHEATQRTLIACGGSISKDPASTLGGG